MAVIVVVVVGFWKDVPIQDKTICTIANNHNCADIQFGEFICPLNFTAFKGCRLATRHNVVGIHLLMQLQLAP